MTTIQKLNITPEDYETMTLSLYLRWCESVSINTRQFQNILANSAINKWFLVELDKCEADFHQLTERYINNPTVCINDLKKCYTNCTFRMFNIRPMALLEPTRPKSKGINVFNQN